MKNTTRTAIAGLLSAFGAALNALAAEITAGEESTPEAAAPPKTRKPRGTAASPDPVQTTTAAETTSTAQATTASSNGAESPEEAEARYAKNRALIEPIVKSGNGPAVKAAIAKYSANGLKELAAKDQEAFEKDIEELSY